MANFCVKCYTGVFCSACYLAISIWGFIFLGILAILFKTKKQGNIGHFENVDKQWLNMLIASMMYLVLGIVCAIILKYRIGHPFPEEDEKEAEEEVDDKKPETKVLISE